MKGPYKMPHIYGFWPFWFFTCFKFDLGLYTIRIKYLYPKICSGTRSQNLINLGVSFSGGYL